MKPLSWWRLSAAILLAGMWGCGGDSADRVPVHPVSGTITMAGNPVANAVVTFSPEADQPVAMGRTDGSGKFILTTYDASDGAALGDYKVMVTKAAPSATVTSTATHNASDPTSSVNAGELHSAARRSGQTADADAILPSRYASKGETDLRATVTEDGENVFDFDLQP